MRKLLAQREVIQAYISERDSHGAYVPAYVKNSFFYGNPSDVTAPYEPNETISESTWNRWNELYKVYIKDEKIAIEAFRSDEPNDLLQMNTVQMRAPNDRERSTGLLKEWIDDLDFCVNLIKDNLGIEVSEGYFNYYKERNPNLLGIWESEFSRQYVYCYPITYENKTFKKVDGLTTEENLEPIFIESFLQKIERLDNSDSSKREIMLALRDYWFAEQSFVSNGFHLSNGSGSFMGPYSGNSSKSGFSFRQIVSFILKHRCLYEVDDLRLDDNSCLVIDGEVISLGRGATFKTGFE